MALAVTHTFVSPVADNGDPNEVGPNEWNAAHTLTGSMSAAQHGTQTDDTLHALATSGAAGFMSTSDKIKLDALSGTNTGDETAAGLLAKLLTVDGPGSGLDADTLGGISAAGFAPANLGTFSTISVSGQSDVVADDPDDTLTLAAGSGITITTNAGSDTVTIAATGGGASGVYANWTTFGENTSTWYDRWEGDVTGQAWVTDDTSIIGTVRPGDVGGYVEPEEFQLMKFQVHITYTTPGVGWGWVVFSETEFRGIYGISFVAHDINTP